MDLEFLIGIGVAKNEQAVVFSADRELVMGAPYQPETIRFLKNVCKQKKRLN